ncbi:MAG: PAS domain-containing sensor histidine kinase [Ignavibacteriae bacterium]|nr:PAS domain-containing sensor histidine kinase [Ignavibacteriota bacterium]
MKNLFSDTLVFDNLEMAEKVNQGNLETLLAMFDSSPACMSITTEDRIFVRINKQFLEIYGFEEHEVIGRNASEIGILDPTEHQRVTTIINEKGRIKNEIIKCKSKDGKDVFAISCIEKMEINGHTYLVSSFLDITPLEEAKSELEKTKKELKSALEKEIEINEMKSRFVSMASHEFRTPLTAMMSSLSLVTTYAEHNDLENHSRHVLKIKKSINNLTDILDYYLSDSQLEEGKVEVTSQLVVINEFIEEVLHELQDMSIDHRLLYEHTGSKTCNVDPKLMKNILLNLISNAIKFSPANSEITLRSEGTPTSLTVSVSDNGIGIPKEDQEHLFGRFFRANNATNIQGTGLGLNIVARYVNLMCGTIAINSEQNKGTTVTIEIPQN